MNNLVGCELRHDEHIVKMFQVITHENDASPTPETRDEGLFSSSQRMTGDNGRRSRRGKHVGVPPRSLLSVMDHVADWQRRTGNRHPVCVLSK